MERSCEGPPAGLDEGREEERGVRGEQLLKARPQAFCPLLFGALLTLMKYRRLGAGAC